MSLFVLSTSAQPYPTLKKLCRAEDRVENDREFEFTFSSGRVGSGPATWGQQAIWHVVRHLGDDAARYNVSGGTPLSTPLPVARVGAVVRELALLHDSLRTRLHETGGGLEQSV